MRIVFISDLHLSPEYQEKTTLFLHFLQKWHRDSDQQLDALYILGDFFDYWLGDDDENEFIKLIKNGLAQFSQHTPIYFIRGNHDFALGKRFAKQTGIQFLKDCSTITINGQIVLLSHGDSFCTLDISYQRLKMFLQNKLILWCMLRLPLKWRKSIKKLLENKNKAAYNQHSAATYMVVDATINRFAQTKGAKIIIHGHTHQPGYYIVSACKNTKQRYELPDWLDHQAGGYLFYHNDSFEFKQYSSY